MTLFTDFVTRNNVTRVWLGWKPADWLENQRDAVDKELSKQVYQFTLKFYQDQVLAQIDESEQAVRAVERAQQKTVNEGSDLQMRLDENSRERVQLERALETNKFNNTILLQKLENNKKSLDSLSVALDKVKKAVELQRLKLREIH
jgi:TolA-binding protein